MSTETERRDKYAKALANIAGVPADYWENMMPEAREAIRLADEEIEQATKVLIDRVRAQHTRGDDVHIDTIHRGLTPVYGDGCIECQTSWPCDTIAALEGVK